ncbi:MAG: FeoB-associated Cys-rich membrane protein [Lentisphaerae bacterium]|mgnify:CR=1 FL=1|jgi:hypothetical protein|nr:FeoB-associated Cys-rich membrane protein [Lentisphaerota bacterium]
MIEHIIVGLIVVVVLYMGGRSFWRTWKSKDIGGCTGCCGCTSSHCCPATALRPLRQGEGKDSVEPSPKEAHSDEQ